jgi:hypothetical protein
MQTTLSEGETRMPPRSFIAGDFDITREKTALDAPALPTAPVARPSELFDAEEMQAIREQYEERLTVEQGRREELEWQLKMSLATMRDAENDARRAADQMKKVTQTLAALIGESAASAPSLAPRAPAQPYRNPVPRAPVSPPQRSLPPLPPPPPTKASPPPPPVAAKASTNGGPLPPRSLSGYKRLVA